MTLIGIGSTNLTKSIQYPDSSVDYIDQQSIYFAGMLFEYKTCTEASNAYNAAAGSSMMTEIIWRNKLNKII